MARRLVVEIVGDASSLERSFSRAQRSTRGFGRDMERAGRGAVVASVGFRGLGRSVAFASAAFIGGAGITAAIRSTITAAAEAQRVGSQLANVLKSQGLATRENVAAINARTTALSQMSGFDDELATQTFVNLLRVTNNVSKALRDNALAADVARGRNIGLDAAAKLVTKAELGQAGALRRVGIAARTGASSVELLDLLQRKFAGSAEAYGRTAAGAQDRFRVALENTQEMIGRALLPSLTRLLNRATEWLNNQENQKRIQDTVNEAVDKGERTASFLARTYGTLKRTVVVATDAIGALRDAVTFETGAEREYWKQLKLVQAQLERLPDLQKRVADGYKDIEAARQGGGATLTSRAPRSATGILPARVGGATFVGRPLTEREQLDLALAANPDDVAALRAKRALEQRSLDFALKQLHDEKGNTAKFVEQARNIQSDITAITQRLAGIAEEQAQKAKDAAARIKAANAKRRQAVLDAIGAPHGGTAGAPGAFARAQAGFRAPLVSGTGFAQPGVLEAAQFRALGLTATGEALAPSRKALRRGLADIEKHLGGTILDSQKNRNLIGRIRRVLSGEFGALNRDVRQKIKELENTLRGSKGGGPVLGRALNLDAVTRGLNRRTALQIQSRLAAQHILVPRVAAEVHLDGEQLNRANVKQTQRRARRTATQTTGRYAGDPLRFG